MPASLAFGTSLIPLYRHFSATSTTLPAAFCLNSRLMGAPPTLRLPIVTLLSQGEVRVYKSQLFIEGVLFRSLERVSVIRLIIAQ
ncbi:hypothetical protein Mtc_0933 [Methanocella conradii HZ254]|uniref:Uncharacterized protein n=1 Tax=Methanocella conradii (strain DSM 24694 / JCM 17849 / CGMCC 1.5162 / HZ254) TaxID=1041930 RepID=H8I4D4_METCZ|nr:hypothetical protein [Methanocella conradii]AFC99691.1 hypothetical protein Mtc_0933 [Methanocella conradii HZ254]